MTTKKVSFTFVLPKDGEKYVFQDPYYHQLEWEISAQKENGLLYNTGVHVSLRSTDENLLIRASVRARFSTVEAKDYQKWMESFQYAKELEFEAVGCKGIMGNDTVTFKAHYATGVTFKYNNL